MERDNSVEMSELLKDLVYEYCKMEQSSEYKKADRLVKDMNGQLESIKTEFKRLNITEMEVETEEGKCKIEFKIGKMERVNTKALPLDIKEKYKAIIDVWKKLVSYKRND